MANNAERAVNGQEANPSADVTRSAIVNGQLRVLLVGDVG